MTRSPTTNDTALGQRVLLITGASRGIGAATAVQAASLGYGIVINYHSNVDAAESVAELCREQGATVLVHQADVADDDAVVAMFDHIEAELGVVTDLVNNAGILHGQSRVEQMTAARLHEVLATNVVGSFSCAREMVARFTKAGLDRGAIVNVSSAAAYLGSANEYVDYAASKGAIDTMTIGLANEVARRGIRVNAVRPGLIETEIHASGGEPGRVDRLADAIPLGRGGSADEVANVIVWLLSDQASYVTGSLINVSGGR